MHPYKIHCKVRSPASAPTILKAFLLTVGFCLFIGFAGQPTYAQTYTVLHSFTGSPDGADPEAGLTRDAAGNFYGTTRQGGTYGFGSVFKLSYKNSAWILTTLYSFKGGADSAWPVARVVFGADGGLYGTSYGGSSHSCSSNGCGTVFVLKPPAMSCGTGPCPWTKTVLHRFTGGVDGSIPGYGDLIFDSAGNIYGTTIVGGTYGWGTVYKLTRTNGIWKQSVIYSFTGQRDGRNPYGGLILDSAGNLYGTTWIGGRVVPPLFMGAGVIFKLSPAFQTWTHTVLYTFFGLPDGALPLAGLTIDSSGSFYGTTSAGGSGFCSYGIYYRGCGTVFRGPQFSTIYSFSPHILGGLPEGPRAAVSIDSARNIYGTTWSNGSYGKGTVFRLTSPLYGYKSLHDFTGNNDGASPVSNVVMDNSGSLYGTTSAGGSGRSCPGGCGVIWKIAP